MPRTVSKRRDVINAIRNLGCDDLKVGIFEIGDYRSLFEDLISREETVGKKRDAV